MISSEDVPKSIPQGLKSVDFIEFIGILRLRSGQAKSRALTLERFRAECLQESLRSVVSHP